MRSEQLQQALAELAPAEGRAVGEQIVHECLLEERIDTLQSALDAKDKELAEARGMLDQYMWTSSGFCICCGRAINEEIDNAGHHDNCELAAFLRDTGEGQKGGGAAPGGAQGT